MLDEKIGVEDLIDDIHDLLDKAWDLPLSGGKSVVDVKKVREILENMRKALPEDIAQAEKIVADRAQIIESAQAQADDIIARAEERRKQLVDEQEIVQDARRRAEEMETAARKQAEDIIEQSLRFADDLLKRTEDGLSLQLSEIRRTRASVKSSMGETSQQ